MIPEIVRAEKDRTEAVAKLSVTVKLPQPAGEMSEESQWLEQPLISKLLEKLRRATETVVDHKGCKPVDKKRGGQSREDHEMEPRTIFKKPHQVAGKLYMSERRVLAKEDMGGVEVKMADEGNKRKAVTAEL